MIDFIASNPIPVVAGSAALLSAGVALRIRRLNSLEAAHTAFRAAFADELSTLRELHISDFGEVFNLLRPAYAKHEAAYIEYSNRLGFVQRLCLHRKWLAYRGAYPKPPQLPEEDATYRLCHLIGQHPDEERQKQQEAIRAITRLIT